MSVHVALERPLGEFARPLQGEFTTVAASAAKSRRKRSPFQLSRDAGSALKLVAYLTRPADHAR
jgi:hypothetical protein